MFGLWIFAHKGLELYSNGLGLGMVGGTIDY
jgi:hypothetical protein